MAEAIRFIDLFAGIGGIRKGFELACEDEGYESKCVFTSEIKPYAVEVLKQNHCGEKINGDITLIDSKEIPNSDFLLAGFPCQAFSSAGKRLGFQDTRGTLFFDVERILKEKKPFGFVLENVEGLVNHDKESPNDPIGRTLSTILTHLDSLGYKVSWKILNAANFGVPQERKRIYIVGTKKERPDLEGFQTISATLKDVLETGKALSDSEFVKNLLSHYTVEELCGKSIKDKRGGIENIHSWDIELKGPTSAKQKELLACIMTERRKKKWAEEYGTDWMDGMPLTIEMIRTFFNAPDLEEMLEDLVEKKYLRKEYPKKKTADGRVQDKLLNEYQIKSLTGQIRFHLGDVGGDKGIVVKKKDVIGNIVQEWFEEWLKEQNIEFDSSDNTQMPPDVYLNPNDHTRDLLEIKAFNFESSPGFDIADFKAFVNELIKKPYYLETDFMVFAYIMDDDTGDVIIKNVWLKKIWEITRPMKDWPITLQYKNGSVNKMRPGNWYSGKRTYPIFPSKEDYLAAFEQTVYQCPDTRAQGAQWKNRFRRSYKNHYGVDIDFPRWDDIKGRYGIS